MRRRLVCSGVIDMHAHSLTQCKVRTVTSGGVDTCAAWASVLLCRARLCSLYAAADQLSHNCQVKRSEAGLGATRACVSMWVWDEGQLGLVPACGSYLCLCMRLGLEGV
eukprot:1160232-Pelagomonas_calceolata.AAC.5